MAYHDATCGYECGCAFGRASRAARCNHNVGGAHRIARLVLCVAAVFALATSLVLLSGCKYSDVLTQHTEDPERGVLDENAEPIYQSNPDAEEIPDLEDVSVSDSNDQNEQVAKLPHYDPQAPDNGPTRKLVYTPDTPNEEEAAEGEADEEPDREGEGEGDTGGEEVGVGEGLGEGNDEGSGEELESDEADGDPTQSTEDGAGGETVVVNPDGTNTETETGTVAAVGEYATMAQMLGGAGALAAADKSWLDARGDDGVFSGELDRVEVGFTGDGTLDGSCKIDALIDTIKPSVVLWDSANNIPNLSSDERKRLEKAGVTVQPMPHIGEKGTEDYEVVSALQAVAAVLDGATGLQYDPSYTLSEYTKFHDDTLRACYDANDGYSYKVTDGQYDQLYQKTPLAGLSKATTTRSITVFVDKMKDFGSKATVAQTAFTSLGAITLAHDGQALDISDGVGLSVASSKSGYQLIDYYLQLAGVMNNAYDTAQPESQGRRYILMPGNTDSFGKSSNYASRITGSAFFFNSGDATVLSNWHTLGDVDFNTVLASDEDVAKALVQSASKKNGLYHMEDPYTVIVVPSGIDGSWSEGHLDSFLLVPWAFRIQGESNISAAKDYASAFYTNYLRCSDWEKAIANWDSAYTAH